jgi:hypothetical protein
MSRSRGDVEIWMGEIGWRYGDMDEDMETPSVQCDHER